MMPYPVSDPDHQPARLGKDPANHRIEVRQQQTGQLQAALIDHMATRCRRRVASRVVSLSVYRPDLPPRHRSCEVSQPEL